jgi:hypothetical protein
MSLQPALPPPSLTAPPSSRSAPPGARPGAPPGAPPSEPLFQSTLAEQSARTAHAEGHQDKRSVEAKHGSRPDRPDRSAEAGAGAGGAGQTPAGTTGAGEPGPSGESPPSQSPMPAESVPSVPASPVPNERPGTAPLGAVPPGGDPGTGPAIGVGVPPGGEPGTGPAIGVGVPPPASLGTSPPAAKAPSPTSPPSVPPAQVAPSQPPAGSEPTTPLVEKLGAPTPAGEASPEQSAAAEAAPTPSQLVRATAGEGPSPTPARPGSTGAPGSTAPAAAAGPAGSSTAGGGGSSPGAAHTGQGHAGSSPPAEIANPPKPSAPSSPPAAPAASAATTGTGSGEASQVLGLQAPLAGSEGAAALGTGGQLLTSGVPMQDMIDSIRATIEIATRRGVTQAKIALKPDDLGEISIHLSQSADGLIARVTADTPAAAQALTDAHSELRQSLGSLGLPLLGLDIGSSGQSQTGERDEKPARSAGASVQPDDLEGVDAVGETDASPSTAGLASGGLVDVLA